VKNNILAASSLHGIAVVTGDAPGSVLSHTTITQNLVVQNAVFGILVLANPTAAGSDTRITQTTITDNEVRENIGGIFVLPQSAHTRITDATIARNTISANVAAQGIQVSGGIDGPGENTLEVSIRNNTVTDNGAPGIRIAGGEDNSSNNQVKAKITANTLERTQPAGIVIRGGFGTGIFPSDSASVHNVVEVRIERNTLTQHDNGISIFGGAESVANNNQVTARVERNVVADSTVLGIGLAAGGPGVASDNTLDIKVAHNTVCGDGPDIVAEGGFSGNDLLFPNQGSGNVLDAEISKNTATTVTVADGIPGNMAMVTQNNNAPCP
jgi:hypothetical protein